MQPQIISSSAEGFHNSDIAAAISRLDKDCSYKDLSTIWVTPAFGTVPTRVLASWLSAYTPPNQKFVRMFAVGMEVGQAYSACIENILAHPELSKFKYIICVEHDNTVPPDGLVRLIYTAETHPEFAVIGASYWTKGVGGVWQGWGDPRDGINFRPQKPDPSGGLVEVNGTGMGLTLYRLEMFKDTRLRRPWFKTTSSATEGCQTQDLYFASDARKHGYRCAIDCSVKSGHYDLEGKYGPADMVW